MNQDRPQQMPTIRSILGRGHFQLVIVAVLLASAAVTINGAFLLRSYVHANLALSARTLRYAVEPAVYFEDRQALREAIGSVVGSGDLQRVEVIGAGGETLMAWQAGAAAGPGPVARVLGALAPETITLPITAASGEEIGRLRVTGSHDRLVRYALAGLIICLCSIGLTVLATRILARRLHDDVVVPIEQLAHVAQDVRENREFAVRAAPSRVVELNAFANDFNALLVELQAWHDGFLTENRTLAHLAEHDPLTGLGNRLLFERELQRAMSLAESNGLAFTLLFIDLNGFKQVNDTLGHLVGDAMLAELAQRIRETLRERDQAFRLGGDEFAVLTDPVARQVNGQAMVNRIAAATKEDLALMDGKVLPISVSTGVSFYPADGTTAEALIGHADAQMYAQKKEARLKHGQDHA